MFIDLFGANIRIICETFRQKEQNMGNCIENLSIKIIPFELSVLSVLLNGFSSFSFRHLPCSSVFWLKVSPEGLFSAFSHRCAALFSYHSVMYFLQVNLLFFATFTYLFTGGRLESVERMTEVVRLNDSSWLSEQLQWVTCNVTY